MARHRGRTPGGHVWKEWEHPRDEKGRFAKTGSEAWARKAVAKAAHFALETGRDVNPGYRPGEGPHGRLPGGLLVNTPKKPTPEQADRARGIREGGRLMDIGVAVDDRSTGQVRVGGRWRNVVSRGSEDGRHALTWQDPDTGDVGKVVQDTGSVMVRDMPKFEAHAPLNDVQQSIMDTRLKMAEAKPQFAIQQSADPTLLKYQREVDAAKAELAEATRKAKNRAARGFPKSDGPNYKAYRQEFVDRRIAAERFKVERAQMFLDGYQAGAPRRPRVGDAPAVHTGVIDHEHPLALYGDMLHIEHQDQATHRSLNDLSTIPAPLHAIVAAEMFRTNEKDKEDGLSQHGGIYVGSTGVDDLDHMQDVKGQDPGGGWAGRQWSDIDGVFRGSSFSLVVGHTANAETKHGGAGRHEFGHALDAALGRAASYVADTEGRRYAVSREASASEEWKALYRRAVAAAPRISPYYLQAEAGPAELWAEAFAQWAEAYYKERQRYIRDSRLGSHHTATLAARFPNEHKKQQERSAGYRVERALTRKFALGVDGVQDASLAADMAAYFKRISDAAGVDWSV